MKYNIEDPGILSALASTLRGDKDFSEVESMAYRNVCGPTYFVGGKIYRNLVSLVHGYDCGADSADWDFFCAGEVVNTHRTFMLPEWHRGVPYYQGATTTMVNGQKLKVNSMCLKKLGKELKIDIIGIKDIQTEEPPIVQRARWAREQYFSVVSLDIQAIAFDLEECRLYERGAMKAIRSKSVNINNAEGALPYVNVLEYIREKAESLRFTHNAGSAKGPCNCF